MAFLTKKNNSVQNYLELTPYRIHTHEINDDGLVDVLVPRFSDKFLGKLIQPRLKNPYFKANFDEFGSAVWLLMTGENKVDLIGKELDIQFGEKINPVYDRLTLFLTQLYRNGFISFIEFRKG